MSDRNSSGERLYKDTGGVKCNIRGMIQREPEWVASRFNVMEDERDRLKSRVEYLEKQRKAREERMHAIFDEFNVCRIKGARMTLPSRIFCACEKIKGPRPVADGSGQYKGGSC